MKLLNGINRDVAHVDQPGGTYRRARNMILDDLAGTLATEKAPLKLEALDDGSERFQRMELCGEFKVPGDRTVFAIRTRVGDVPYDQYKAEQVLSLSPDGVITELAAGPAGTFGIDAATPFQGVGYVNGADNLVLVYTDGVNKPRYITYTGSGFEGPFLVFPEANFPMARPIKEGAFDTSGNILAGNYTFVIAYEVQAGTDNITQYGPTMGSYQIGAETTDETKSFRTSAKMKFYGLDTNYEYVRIYAIREFNGTEYLLYADRFAVQAEDMEWSYIGQEVTQAVALTADALLIPRESYQTAETVAVSDDRMFLANLTTDNITFEEGQAIANNLDVHWTTDEEGLYSFRWDMTQLETPDPFSQTILNFYPLRQTNTTGLDWSITFPNRNGIDNRTNANGGISPPDDNAGVLGGFMPGEVYALYISFLRKDGTWTNAFHIPGGGDSGDFSSAARLNTATVSNSLVDMNQSAGTWELNLAGRPGYTVNVSDEYSDNAIWQADGLTNTGVRHHQMPTARQLWESQNTSYEGNSDLNVADYEHEWCTQTLGLYVDNVVIPDAVADKIQGFQIFYAKAQTVNERKIKAYVPTWRWEYESLPEFEKLLRVYDPYLLQTKPQINGWKAEEVYKQMSYLPQRGHTLETGEVDEYAFLPNNVIYGEFDNEHREPVLGLKMLAKVDYTTDWDAGYPGYYAGFQQTTLSSGSAIHGNNGLGWHVQPKFDQVNDGFPKPPGGTMLHANFTSTFGSYQVVESPASNNGLAPFWSREFIPEKTNINYGVVYEDGETPGQGTWYRANAEDQGDAQGDVPAGAYMGWGGPMGSFTMLYEELTDFFVDYSSKTLAATHDFVRVNDGGTFSSNQAIRGGDTWITPVVVEFMYHAWSPETIGDYAYTDANGYGDYDTIQKVSYFTWSHVLPSKNDLADTFTWQDLSDDWGVGTGKTPFNGETMNTYNFGAQWFRLNEKKSAFPVVEQGLEVFQYPNRIVRSSKQNYESNKIAWTQFLAGDYYDNALGKESIRNLEDYKGELIIHHGDSIFKTRSKFNIDASGTDVFIGSGDIFSAPPQELFVDAAGYAGVTHWADTLLSRIGYTWVDRNAGRIFNLSGQLDELSGKGLRNFMRDSFITLNETVMDATGTPSIFSANEGGYSLGFDPYNNRLLVTKRQSNGSANVGGGTSIGMQGVTYSYSLNNGCWASDHSYVPYRYFQTYNKLFAWNEAANGGVFTGGSSTQLAAMFEINGAGPGVNYNNDGTEVTEDNRESSYVDAVFNMGGATSKLWQNFNWVTRSGEGENAGVKYETFDRARIYNDHQISFFDSNFRLTDNKWQWNEFRDWSKEDVDAQSWFIGDNTTFAVDANIMDSTKRWYELKRFVSDYAVIRLETLNSTGRRLYLLDVAATARRAVR